jgi:hypothetical protein
MMAKDAAGIRRVWVDSGLAASPDPGARIIAFVAERWYYAMGPLQAALPTTRSTLAASDVMKLDLPPPPIGTKTYMDGFEGSDLVGVYYALDKLGEVSEGETVEILGDGQVYSFLRGESKVSARYAGHDWAPEMRDRIRDAEERFPKVVYRTIASSQNRAGHLVDELKSRRRAEDGQLWFGYDNRP